VRVAVIGAGAFGRNHVRVYSELASLRLGVELCAVVDRDATVRAAVEAQYGIPGYASVAELMAASAEPGRRIHAASVCVPTVHHAAVAGTLLPQGIDLLIEKPLAATLAEADEIVSLAAQHHRIVQAGHLERFNPAVTAARQYLRQPMFFEAHRLSVFTPRSLDVDVVLDLMIHDLDIVLSMVASPVREVRAVGLPVLSGKVDIANVRVEFENGCVANFTASRVSTERVRKLRFFQPRQYLSLDFARQDLLVIDAPDAAMLAGMDAAQLSAALARLQEGQHPSAGLSLHIAEVEQGEPLRLELLSFLNAVRQRTAPVVSAENGRAALALALEINAAIADHAQRAGLTILS
jgi:predicted dehydrogenase